MMDLAKPWKLLYAKWKHLMRVMHIVLRLVYLRLVIDGRLLSFPTCSD